jgi:hypothetical protein
MTEVTESQLREMFDAYAGPEGPKARSGRSRSPRPLALLAVVALAIAVSLAVFAYDRSDGVRSEGGLARVTAGPMRSIPFRISLDEMIAKSDLIFVGTVTTIEGPEELSPANPPDYPDPILAYRVTFEVERLLRGDVEREIEVTNTMGRGPAFSAEVGEEYLVFAAHDEVGYEHVPRLVAVGIDQGVFRVTGPNTAENSRTVTLQLDEVDRRVAGAERSDGGAS